MNTLENNLQLNTDVIALQEKVQDLEQKLKYANEQLEWFRKNIFGKRSKKIVKTIEDLLPDNWAKEKKMAG